jgi:hypothetical protein
VTGGPRRWRAGTACRVRPAVVSPGCASAGAVINLGLVIEDARRSVSTRPAVSRAQGGRIVPYGPAATVAETTR